MSDVHESAGSYALDALDAAELSEYEAHLGTCESCQNEVAGFGEVAGELSLLSMATPAPSLRDNILAAIATTPQLPSEGNERPAGSVNGTTPRPGGLVPRTGSTAEPRRALPGSEVVEEPVSPPVDELAVRRQWRRNRFLTGLVAAMLALAVGLGGVVYSLTQQRRAEVAAQAREQQLYQAPDARAVTAELTGGGSGTFIASKRLNRALFIGTDLPNPGPNRYQLWIGTGNPQIGDGITGIFRDVQVAETSSGFKVYFSGDVTGADFLAVNLEPAGSTPAAPTNDPLALPAI